MRRRALLTGGAGFVGSHLAERLLALDIDVICLDNFVTGDAENVAHLHGRNGFRLIEADVSEYISIPGPVDYVLHFASPASPVDYAELPIETLKVGSLGTLHTLGLAKEKGARYLLASTSESYGDPLVHPQPETYWGNVNPVGPRACYDEAKRFAEALTTSYRTTHGVNTAIMRIFNTYGPRMRANDGRAIPTFINQALSGASITVQGDGSQTRSVCHVDDLVEGALRLLFSDLTGPVNIGSPHEMTILELANLIRELTGSDSPVEFIERAKDDPSQRRPDITLARNELDWEPKIHVRDGLLTTIDWVRSRPGAVSHVGVHPRIDTRVEQPELQHKVAVIGTGYVGAVTSVCLAFLGHSVFGVDSDSVRAGQLNNGQAPFHEPGLPDLLKRALSTGRLRFTDDPAEALTEAEFVFLCVGTPPAPDGAPDLTQLETAIESLAPYLRAEAVIVNKSTVPVGSGNWTRTILEDALEGNRELAFHVVSNPEFLREGSAIHDFLYPDRIVLGGAEPDVSRYIVNHICDLVALCAGASGDAAAFAAERGGRAARLQAVKAAIETRVGGPAEFSVEDIAADVGVSARYVRKLLEAEGASFSRFVAERRLARAYALLTDPKHARMSVSAIAYEVGFGDLSYFNRSFRRAYDCTPSDLRAERRQRSVFPL